MSSDDKVPLRLVHGLPRGPRATGRHDRRDTSEREPELLTIPAAARRIGIGTRQLRRAVKEGELSAYQIGSWPRVRWIDVTVWVRGRRVPATGHARRRVSAILEREARNARRG